MLKPQTSSKRELLNLDGLWDFKVDINDEGFKSGWAQKNLETSLQAPVPASYNEIFTEPTIREHCGWVWYQRKVRVPRGWGGERIFVRADSATHEGVIFCKRPRGCATPWWIHAFPRGYHRSRELGAGIHANHRR